MARCPRGHSAIIGFTDILQGHAGCLRFFFKGLRIGKHGFPLRCIGRPFCFDIGVGLPRHIGSTALVADALELGNFLGPLFLLFLGQALEVFGRPQGVCLFEFAGLAHPTWRKGKAAASQGPALEGL